MQESTTARRDALQAPFAPLEAETRSHVPTADAAHYLNRKPQTLRTWACHENGPIRPVRLHGRLAWPMDAIRELLGVSA